MIRLPFDIIAHVTQCLWDDPHTLCTCTLLSRMWHEVCRPQILYKITIDVRRHKDEPLKRLEHLLDSDPSIHPLVRQIRISFLESDRERGSSCQPWMYDFPRLLYQKLPCVGSLEIVGLGLPEDDFPPIFYQQLRQATSIKRLSLVYSCILYEVLNSLVSSLQNLEELHIHGQWLASRIIGPDDFNLDRIPSPLRMPPLKSFYYHNDDASGPSVHAFLNWVAPIRTLRSVGIHVDEVSSLKAVAEFIQQRGSTLENIELRFLDSVDSGWESGIFSDDTKLYFNLTTHTSLKTLHLSLTDDITGPHLLSQIAYIRPMRIILTDSRYNIENLLKAGEHVVFDDLLSGATFRHLPEILFVYRGVREPRKEMIKKLFPKLCADDRLRILWSKGPTDLCCVL